MPLEEALERAEELYLNAARRMFRMLQPGNGHLAAPPGVSNKETARNKRA